MNSTSLTNTLQRLYQPHCWLPRRHAAIGVDVGTYWTKILWLNNNWSAVREACWVRIPTTLASTNMLDRPNVETLRPGLDRLAQHVSQAISKAQLGSLQYLAAALSMAWSDIVSVDSEESLTQPSSPALQKRLAALGSTNSKLCIAELPKPIRANECFEGRRFMCLPEQIPLDFVNAMRHHHLELDRLEGAPWCLARSLQLVADPDQVEVLIDWGYSAVTLVACYQQELLFCRKLECPALLGIVSQLQQSFQLSTAAAARFLERMSLSPANTPNSERRADDKCVRILNEHASLLNREIRVALKYLAWRMPTVPCQRLWITGGGACASALMELLNQQSPLPCRAWSWQPAAHLPALPADMAIAAALAQGE